MRYVPRLHVITHESSRTTLDHVALAEAAYAGGAGVVQFREKRAWSTRALLLVARRIAAVAGDRPLIINDRTDVAAAASAGVHVGDDDLPVLDARRLVGADVLLGVSVGSVRDALSSADWPVDYIGVGPVFSTSSKADAGPPLGTDGLAAIVACSPHPVIAIGGIDVECVEAVMRTGAHGVAVLSAVCDAADPRDATRAIRDRMERAR